jgi:hypothetical protein
VLGLVGILAGVALLIWLGARTSQEAGEQTLADNEVVPGEADELRDQAVRVEVPDTREIIATLRLGDGGLLEFRYGPINDSGVKLRRIAPDGKVVVWTQYCPPLGVAHSEYLHEVFVHIEGRTARVISRGSYGTFAERLELDSGTRVARSVRKDGW